MKGELKHSEKSEFTQNQNIFTAIITSTMKLGAVPAVSREKFKYVYRRMIYKKRGRTQSCSIINQTLLHIDITEQISGFIK